MTTSAMMPVAVVRQSTTELRIRVQIPECQPGEFAEYTLVNIGSNGGWWLRKIRARDPSTGSSYYMVDVDSVWEYAFKPGDKDSADTEANWPNGGYYGGTHGNETQVSWTAKCLPAAGGEIDLSVLDSKPGYGFAFNAFRMQQVFLTYLPKNGTTFYGMSVLTHYFDETGLTVSHDHYPWDPTLFQLRRSYSAMLPTTNVGNAGINRIKIGTESDYTVAADGSEFAPSTAYAIADCWHSTAHPYHLIMELPSGGPDVAGDWSRASAKKLWVKDNAAAGGVVAYAKVYCNFVAEEYANRAAAVASRHVTNYRVTKPA